jgi:hypothetical protein
VSGRKSMYRKFSRLNNYTLHEPRANYVYYYYYYYFYFDSLAQHNSVTNGLFSSAIEEFTKRLGWIIGLHTGPEPFWRQIKDTSLATAGSPAIGYVGVRPWE